MQTALSISIKHLRQKSHSIFGLLKSYYHAAGLKYTLLIAVGGLSRKIQYPNSDIDIVLIYHNKYKELDKIEQFIQICWDNELTVSHNVFNLSDFIKNLNKDWNLVTSFLNSGLIVGNRVNFFQLKYKFKKWMDNNLQNFLTAKNQELEHRHIQFPLFALEPNCKQHAGGLRDLDYINWICNALHIPLHPLFLRKYLKISCFELKEYKKQLLFLSSIRHYLHIITQKREDTLRFEYQPIIAQHLHYFNNDNQLAQEQLMHTYFRATRTVTHILKQFQFLVEKFLEKSQNFSSTKDILNSEYSIENDYIDVNNEDFFINYPNKILEIFYLLNIYDDFTILTQRAIFKAKKYFNQEWRDNTHNIHLFIRILRSKKVYKILNSLHEHSILGKYLPYFRNITGQLQHDLLHIYTVDQHTLKVINYLHEFTKVEKNAVYPLVSHILLKFKNFWLIYVAALFHDLGKGQGGNHSLIGAVYIKEFCSIHNISKAQTKLLVWLIEHHLLLSYCAQNQDIHQEQVIENFCRKIKIYIPCNKSTNRFKAKIKIKPIVKKLLFTKSHAYKNNLYALQALYILTIADIKGTNPKAYNSWRSYLIDNFFIACEHYLTNKSKIKSFSIINKQQESLLEIDINKQEIAINWFNTLNQAFFIRKDSQDVAWITKKIISQHPLEQTGVYIKEKNNNQWQIWIHTPDVPFLFAHICKILSHKNISIMHADLDSTKYKYAINLIEVDASQYILAYNDSENTSKYIYLLTQNIQEEINNIYYLKLKSENITNHYSARIRQFLGQTKVNILLENGQHALHIKTIDQIGLLYKISCVLAENNINIKQAHIITMGERVEDTFFIQSSQLHDKNFLINLEIQILRSIN